MNWMKMCLFYSERANSNVNVVNRTVNIDHITNLRHGCGGQINPADKLCTVALTW